MMIAILEPIKQVQSVECVVLHKNGTVITRESVLELIKRIPMALTSKEMARVLQVKEVSVRAAIIWLELGGYIKKVGDIRRKYQNKSYTKKIALWRWTGKLDPIGKVSIKETDLVDRERNSKYYGDCVLLQTLVLSMGNKTS